MCVGGRGNDPVPNNILAQDASARAYELELSVRCGMCLEVVEDLRLLPCLHSFCADCLRTAAAAATGGRIACPLCKASVRVCVCVCARVRFVCICVFEYRCRVRVRV